MLATVLALALTIWPFSNASHLNRPHSRAAHARHLAHIQQARHKALAHRHAAPHPSLLTR